MKLNLPKYFKKLYVAYIVHCEYAPSLGYRST